MEDLQKIRKRAKVCADVRHHDLAFALQVLMHGDLSAIEDGTALTLYAPNRNGCADLPDYGEINLPLGPMGVMNHSEINSRINIQGMIHVDPVINIESEDPIFAQTNSGWWRQSWQDADWASQYYQAGMEFEAQGLGAVEYGPDTSGRIVCYHRPYLDTIKDRMYSTPNQWRGVFHRRRLDLDEAGEKYGHLYTEDELTSFAKDFFPVKRSGGTVEGNEERVPVIHEWHYQDPTHECFFLRSIAEGEGNVVIYDDDLELVKGTKAGPNPNGFIPWAWWVDSYLPSSMNPRGKSATVIRIATMLNETEKYMVEMVRRDLPLLGVNEKATPKLLEQLRECQGSKDLMKIMVLEGVGDIREIFSRLPSAGLNETLVYLRGVLKDELNAATGVMDMQRGQELQRDRVTRYEVSQLVSKQGVQAHHVRRRFAHFVEQGFQISRALGALWDDMPRIIPLDGGSINTKFFPITAHLAAPCIAHVDPEMMRYISDDEKRQRAIEEFQSIKMVAIELGVADPYKTMFRLYQQVGYKDPVAEGLFSLAEYQMIQQQMALAQAAGMGPEEENGSQSSSGNNGSRSNGQAKQRAGSPAGR